MTRPIGRLDSDASPDQHRRKGCAASTPDSSRMVVPEFWASSGAAGARRPRRAAALDFDRQPTFGGTRFGEWRRRRPAGSRAWRRNRRPASTDGSSTARRQRGEQGVAMRNGFVAGKPDRPRDAASRPHRRSGDRSHRETILRPTRCPAASRMCISRFTARSTRWTSCRRSPNTSCDGSASTKNRSTGRRWPCASRSINAITHGNDNDPAKCVFIDYCATPESEPAEFDRVRARSGRRLRSGHALKDPSGARERAEVERARHVSDSAVHGRRVDTPDAAGRHGDADDEAHPARRA